MNDFKEYSAAFQDHQNSLMHYGVKGMKWDPSKKKKTTSKEEDTASEQRKNVVNTVGLAGRSLGAAVIKGIYDNVPKRKNVINAKSFRRSSTLVSRKAPNDSHSDEQVDTKKKKKNRGRMPRGRYSERG